jgi:protein dithiol:quinone oxidoreductase
MSRIPPRWLFALTALICAALLSFGYYLQYHDGLEPCPMCIFQRICYFAILGTATVAALHGPTGVGGRFYAAIAGFSAVIGGAIAGRQVWLQHLPADQVPECGPGLEFMLEVYPLAEVIKTALRGTGECATVVWTFLGGSIAEWSLACFAGLAVAYAVLLVRFSPRHLGS